MISIVIPLYNKERSIVSTIESVFIQTYKDWELIIVDDGSTDKSLQAVEGFIRGLKVENWRLKIVSKPNGGVCSARNRGIIEAKGEFVALLDGDDLWDKEYLTEQVKMIRDFPEAAMWGINFAEVNKGKLVRSLRTALPDGYRGYVENYFQMNGRISDLFCSSSVIIRKEVFNKLGMFDERIKYAEDTDMWWRIIATNPVAFYDKYMVFYRYDAENRALKRERRLRNYLPYYIDKYQTPIYQSNKVFYRRANHWAASQIRSYFFSLDKEDRADALEAVKKIDYAEVPFKYRLLYKWPYVLAKVINKLDKLYHR
jgi:glycosyltransferase involved in cell wall biosynthesis